MLINKLPLATAPKIADNRGSLLKVSFTLDQRASRDK